MKSRKEFSAVLDSFFWRCVEEKRTKTSVLWKLIPENKNERQLKTFAKSKKTEQHQAEKWIFVFILSQRDTPKWKTAAAETKKS